MELQDLHGKSWKQLNHICKHEILALAFTKNESVTRAVKLTAEEHKPVVVASYLAAVLMAERNPMMAIDAGSFHYLALVKKHNFPQKVKDKVWEMEEGVAWGGTPYRSPCPTDKWPIRPPKKLLEDHGGLLNFLLYEGITRMDTTSGRDFMVRRAVVEFMNWMMAQGGLRELRKAA
jgi:hypothetical protein